MGFQTWRVRNRSLGKALPQTLQTSWCAVESMGLILPHSRQENTAPHHRAPHRLPSSSFIPSDFTSRWAGTVAARRRNTVSLCRWLRSPFFGGASHVVWPLGRWLCASRGQSGGQSGGRDPAQ